jgi:hypothetical protein
MADGTKGCPVTLTGFAVARPQLAAQVEQAIADHDARHSAFWPDGEARALRARIGSGARDLHGACVFAESLSAGHRLAESRSGTRPDTGKRRLGAAGLDHGWRLHRRRERLSHQPTFTIACGRRAATVTFNHLGAVQYASYRTADGRTRLLAAHAPDKAQRILDHLNGTAR